MTNATNRKRSGNSQENDSGWTPQQVIQMGEMAAQTLRSPVYNVAHRLAVNDLIDAWSRTDTQEMKKRESLWFQLQALGKAAEIMGTMVGRAEQLLEAQAGKQEQEEMDYLNDQGFGYPPMGGDEAPFQ